MNKYIEHIIKDMVRDTDIDYDNDRIRSPFSLTSHQPTISLISYIYLSPYRPSFSMYCEDTYGLTKTEIEYVWNQYRDIIKDRLRNEK